MSLPTTYEAVETDIVGRYRVERAKMQEEIDRLKIRSEAYENAYRIAYQATYQSHSGHWDKTGQHGAGCPECIRAREARENCDAALREGLDELIERAIQPSPSAAARAEPMGRVRHVNPIERMLLESVEWEATAPPPDERYPYPYPIHSGVFDLFGTSLRFYRLNDGRTIIHADDIHAVLNEGDKT